MCQDILEQLRAVAPKLDDWGRTRANDLLASAQRYTPTPKQIDFMHRLVARADGGGTNKVADIGDLSGVLKLFNGAAEHLKRPAIVLVGDDGVEIKVSIASENAKVPGSLTIAENNGYGQSKWFGRVLRSGEFQRGRDVAPNWLVPLLLRFASEPAKVAAEFGQLTGRCCFCDRKLDDERSTAAGFGPVCARRWKLEGEWKSAVKSRGLKATAKKSSLSNAPAIEAST